METIHSIRMSNYDNYDMYAYTSTAIHNFNKLK